MLHSALPRAMLRAALRPIMLRAALPRAMLRAALPRAMLRAARCPGCGSSAAGVADRRACAAAHPRAPVDAAHARLLVNEYGYHPQAQATTRSSSRLVLPVTVTGAPDISRAGKAARTPENVTVTVRRMPLGWTVASLEGSLPVEPQARA